MTERGTVLQRTPADLDDFRCTACGGCCCFWNIIIDDASFERARRFIENPPTPRPNPDLPWFVEKEGNRLYNMTSAGRCVFLGEDNLCWLHRYDPNLKSNICRIYPFEPVRTPEGYDRSLSFSSRGAFEHVLMNGRPFRIRESRTNVNLLCDAVKAHPVTPLPGLSWKSFLEIERRLIAFLAGGSELEKDLLAGGRFLAEAERRVETGEIDTVLATGLHPKNFHTEDAVSNIDSAHRLVASILTLRLNTIAFDSLRESILALLVRLEKGPVESKMSRVAYYRRLRRNRWIPAESALEPVIRKYLLYKIFFKTFFMEFGLVRGYNMICFLYCVLRLHALFMRDETGPIRPADLFPTFEFVERHFSHAITFNRFWQDLFKGRLLDTADLGEMLILG